MPYDTPINAPDATFDRIVLEFGAPVVAVFWSKGQAPRHSLDSVLDQAASAYAGEILLVKLEAIS